MKEFAFKVVETTTVLKQYIVSAENEPDARDMAESGETDSESIIKELGVINRDIIG